jgi:response regulator RpfG family c-di-GMP phosphodiesterase
MADHECRRRVLVVDDDPTVARSLARLLRQHYEVVTATNAHDGLRSLEEPAAVDAIIADMCMPDMDGMTLLGRASELKPSAARLLLTGHGDLSAGREAVDSGRISHYLAKPCAGADLLAALADCFAEGPTLPS